MSIIQWLYKNLKKIKHQRDEHIKCHISGKRDAQYVTSLSNAIGEYTYIALATAVANHYNLCTVFKNLGIAEFSPN